MQKIKVLFTSCEVAPFIKYGGLGDVAGSLPKALKKANINITICSIYTQTLHTKNYNLPVVKKLKVKFGEKTYNVKIRKGKLPQSNVDVLFFENRELLSQGTVYKGKVQDPTSKAQTKQSILLRYLFFGQCIYNYIEKINNKINIIHANDWHSAVVINLLKDSPNKRLQNIKTVYTVHNLSFLGYLNGDKFFNLIDWDIQKAYHKKSNKYRVSQAIFKNTDLITTVSPTYAKEILTKKFNPKIPEVLRQYKNKLFGVLNGIDYNVFNPSKDKFLKHNYTVKNWQQQKAKNKQLVQKLYKLEVNPDIPIIGMAARITNQKGYEILIPALKKFKKNNIQFVNIGNGMKELENELLRLNKKYPKNIGIINKFSVEIAQKIYAGADMFIVPSLFEPCGLTQMIAFKYGTIPIVRKTGGLKDTVIDYSKNGNGFVFRKYDTKSLLWAVLRASKLYKNYPDMWTKLVNKGMRQDFSWNESAKKYIQLYKKILKKNG